MFAELEYWMDDGAAFGQESAVAPELKIFKLSDEFGE